MADTDSSSNPLLADFFFSPFDRVVPAQLSVSSIPLPIHAHPTVPQPPPSTPTPATSPPASPYIRRVHLLSQSQIDPAARTHAKRRRSAASPRYRLLPSSLGALEDPVLVAPPLLLPSPSHPWSSIIKVPDSF